MNAKYGESRNVGGLSLISETEMEISAVSERTVIPVISPEN